MKPVDPPRTLTPFAAVVEGQRRSTPGGPGKGGSDDGSISAWPAANTAVHTLEIASLLADVPLRPASTMPSNRQRHPVENLSYPMSPTVAQHTITESMPRRVGTPAGVAAARSKQYMLQNNH